MMLKPVGGIVLSAVPLHGDVVLYGFLYTYFTLCISDLHEAFQAEIEAETDK